MARDYDRSEAFPPLGAVLVFVSIPGGSVVYAVLGLTRRAAMANEVAIAATEPS